MIEPVTAEDLHKGEEKKADTEIKPKEKKKAAEIPFTV